MKTELSPIRRGRGILLAVLSLLAAPAVFAWPDLTITKTGPATAAVGDVITYALVYTNKGPISASSVVLTDFLPSQMTPVTNTLGTGTLTGNTITWNLGSLASCKGGRITFQAQVNASATVGQYVTNLARIYTPTAESNTNNNTAKAITLIVGPTCTSPVLAPLASQTACAGGSATFSAVVTGGTAPYHFQWFQNGNLLTGRTNSTLTLTNLAGTDAGSYQVIASNACGSATNSAMLTVDLPVTVVTPPADQTVCPGDTAVFTVVATGDNLGFQWYRDTTVLAGQTNSTLVLANPSAAEAGTYRVVVSGACGTAVTNQAELVLGTTTAIEVPPANQTVREGSNAVFQVTATGTGLSYRWFYSSQLVGTGSQLTLNSVTTNQDGAYCVEVSGACGSPVTACATLTVYVPATVITPPVNQTNCPGSSAVFSITATGTALNYQWWYDTNLLAGQTDSTLILTNITEAEAGIYLVVVNAAAGEPVTNSATLTVYTNVAVTIAPLSQNHCEGDTAAFSVTATGTGAMYQWYRAFNPLPDQTNSLLVLTNVSAADTGDYEVVVSGTCGEPLTNSVTLTVKRRVSATPLISQTNCPGSAASFSTVASGTGPITYAWFKNSILLPAQTNASLLLTGLTLADAGTYAVVVSGACGSVTNAATLTVNTPVSATPLISQTNCPGSTASFSTVASGTGPITYAWFKNGTLLPAQTTASLVLTGLTLSDAGTYTVVVTGACGSVTNAATLTVNTSVSATPLISQTNCPGSAASFSTVASGTGPITYAWFKNGTLLPAQTTASLVLTGLTLSDAGTYRVVVTGACGSVTNAATLTVNTSVSATPLISQTNCPGTTASFSTVASGTGPITYAWFKNGTLLPAQTTASLVLTGLTLNDAGTYSVVVTGACGSVTNAATLTVNTSVSATPLISQTNCPGSTASFSTVASGTGPITYAWFKNGTLLPAQTTASLVLTGLTLNDAGTYSVVVTGACGSVTNAATLTVNASVSATPLISQTNCPGTTASFSTVASGTGPITYAWFKNGTLLPAQTTASLVLTGLTLNDAGTYSVVVTGACGSVTNAATLTVNTSVSATPLISQTNCPGSTASFSTVASGTGPITYAWFKNGTLLPAQTTASLVLTGLTLNDAGTYSVVVTGACGSVTNAATLTVNTSVSATPLISQTNCPGSTASFSTVASGTGPITYAWFKNGTLLPAQTTASLVLTGLTLNDAGTYSVVVTGACGSVTNAATLTVNTSVSATPLISQTNCPGSTASFSTVASSTGPITYAWFKNGTLLPTQTTASLVLTGLTLNDAGTYSVVVTGACGSVTNAATLTVNTSVSATPLISQTNCPGSTASFSTVASGTGPITYAWFKNGTLLPGQTTASLVLTGLTLNDAGTYSVVVSGACGSVTNAATLTVNTSVSATPLISQTNCPGTTASFSTVASGTGPITYAWFKNGTLLPGQTTASLVLTGLTLSDAGTYTVVVTGACGSVTNAATLTVNSTTTASPMADQVRAPGETVVFTTTASGTGPFTYVWKKNGSVISGQTGNSLTLTNLAYASAGLYTVEVSGACNTAIQSASLRINQPPTVSINSPTNGTVYLAPANIVVSAYATDPDGIVTNVAFFQGTNFLGDTTNGNPYVVLLTNVATGSYLFRARATDDGGLSATSAPVNVTVLARPPLSIVTAMHLNLQTGLFEQKVRVSNPTYSTFNAVRVYVTGLQSGVTVYNASGSTNGVPYVQSNQAVPPGSYVDFTIEYYVTVGGVTPNPTLYAELVPAGGGGAAVFGTGQHITRGLMLASQTFMVEFVTLTNRTYYIQYSSDLRTWKAAQPAVTGNGTTIQWIDNGQPKTESAPAGLNARFYRVILLP